MKTICVRCSDAAAYAGKHKWKSSYEGINCIVVNNSWVAPWKTQEIVPLLTEEDNLFLKENNVLKYIKTPSIKIKQGVEIPQEIQQALRNDNHPDIITNYEKELLESPGVIIDSVLPSTLPLPNSFSNGVKIHIMMQRGNIGEIPALHQMILPQGHTVINEQKIVLWKDKYFYIKGRLDGTIYEDKKMVGMVEVKTRQRKPKPILELLEMDRLDGTSAYDLRQLACYWKCLPNLKYYYLLQYYNGEILAEQVNELILEKMWNEMYVVLRRRSKRLIRSYIQHEENK